MKRENVICQKNHYLEKKHESHGIQSGQWHLRTIE